MDQFFAKDFTGDPFVIFNWSHLLFIACVLVGNLLLPRLRNKTVCFKRNFRIGYVTTSILIELSWHAWKAWIGEWTAQEMLPLHVCSIFVVLNAIMMLTRNYRIYEISYFLAIGGAMQAMLTPDAGIYGMGHFRAWQTLLAHALIMSAPIYMTIVEGFRPTWKSLGRVFIFANLYMLVITPFNLLIGSNYMFTIHKPVTASLMDLLHPWPWYLLELQLIALVICTILYLPFAIKDWRASRQLAATAA